MPAGRILFVNKTIDSKSLSRSEGLEKARIFSHVRPLPASKSKEKPLTGSTSRPSSSQGSARRSRGDIAERSGARRPASKKDSHDDSNTAAGQSDRRLGTPARPECCHPIPPHVSSKLDCFNCTIVPMDPFMEDIFSRFRSTIFKSFCTISTSAQKVLDCTLSYCGSNAEVFYAVLCTAAITTFAQTNDQRHFQGFVYFKDRALYHLQQAVDRVNQTAPGIPTVYAVSLLLYLECGQGDLAGAKVHWSGLQRMLGYIECDMQDVPLPIYTLIIACAGFCSAMMASRPIAWPLPDLSNLEKGLKMMESDDPESLAADKTMSGFFNERARVFLGPRLWAILTELHDVVVFRIQREQEQISPSEAKIQSFYARNMATEQKLLSMPFDDENLSPERNAIRLCIYFVSRPNVTLTNPTFPFASSMAQQIKEALHHSNLAEMWAPCPDLLMWVLVIAAHVSYEQEEWPWIVEQAAIVIEAMEITSQEELGEALSGFLMPARPIWGLLQTLWNDVQALHHTAQRSADPLKGNQHHLGCMLNLLSE